MAECTFPRRKVSPTEDLVSLEYHKFWRKHQRRVSSAARYVDLISMDDTFIYFEPDIFITEC